MKEWTITVARNTLFTDIDILSQRYSEVGAASDNLMRGDRISTDTLATVDAHIVKRLCDHRANDIRQVMARFLYEPSAASAATDAAADTDIVFTLSVPTEAENALLPVITDLCHDYIVNGALADYYAQIGSGNTELPSRRANECLARIRELIYHRPMP